MERRIRHARRNTTKKIIGRTSQCGKPAKIFKGAHGLKLTYKVDDNDYIVREYPLTWMESLAPCGGLKSSCGPKCQKRRKTLKGK